MKELISVVIPTYNEEKHIEKSLSSFLTQDIDSTFNIEILVIDGGSTDLTKEIVENLQRSDHRVRMLENKRKRTPYAFNIGINNAKGKYILIAGAHSSYPKDYIKICFNELKAKKANGCSGRTITRPANKSAVAKLAAWVTGHPFGTSPNSFRNTPEGFVSTLPRAIYRKDSLIKAGLYNEKLFRNQDNDINQRIIENGGSLYYTWKTHSIYFAKDNIKTLLKFAFNNGAWNIYALKNNRRSMKAHHFVPLIFISSLLILLIFSLILSNSLPFLIFTLLIVLHLGVGTFFSIKLFLKKRSFLTLLLPIIFLSFHMYYGAGSLFALIKTSIFRRPNST